MAESNPLEQVVQALVEPLARQKIYLQKLELVKLNQDDDAEVLRQLGKCWAEIQAAVEPLEGSVDTFDLLQALSPQVEAMLEENNYAYRYDAFLLRKQRENNEKGDDKKRKTTARLDNVSIIITLILSVILAWPITSLLDMSPASVIEEIRAAQDLETQLNLLAEPFVVILPIVSLSALISRGIRKLMGDFQEANETAEGIRKLMRVSKGDDVLYEEQNWIWLCQRCGQMIPFLGESGLTCSRCHNRMIRVMGRWELQ